MLKKIWSKTLCLIGIHNWHIRSVSIRKRKGKRFFKETFERECQWCEKEQGLERPKKYHPTKFVWTDIS